MQKVQIPVSITIGGKCDAFTVRACRWRYIVPVSTGDTRERQFFRNVCKKMGITIIFIGEDNHFLCVFWSCRNELFRQGGLDCDSHFWSRRYLLSTAKQ